MNDLGQLLSWRGLVRVVVIYFVLMALYNYGLGGQQSNYVDLLVSTVVMTLALTAGTVVVLLLIAIGNRGGLESWQAERALRAGNSQEALARYDQALKGNANRPEALVGRAELLAQVGRNDDARADLDRAIADIPHVVNFTNPLLLRAYVERGRLRDAAGDRRGALEDWRLASRTAPGAPEPYIYRGRTALEVGDWLGGRRMLMQGIELVNRRLAGQNSRAAPAADRGAQLNLRGLAYNLLGEYRSAMADLEQALTLDPNSWVPHFNLGASYLNMGLEEQALSELANAVRLNPAAAAAAKRSRYYAALAGNPAFEALVGGRSGETLSLTTPD